MKGAILAVAVLTLFTFLAIPSEVSAQGRGRGHGNSVWSKKCEKFRNCHDARDGRWDGRGPRHRTTSLNRFDGWNDRNRVGNHRSRRWSRTDRDYKRGQHTRNRW